METCNINFNQIHPSQRFLIPDILLLTCHACARRTSFNPVVRLRWRAQRFQPGRATRLTRPLLSSLSHLDSRAGRLVSPHSPTSTPTGLLSLLPANQHSKYQTRIQYLCYSV